MNPLVIIILTLALIVALLVSLISNGTNVKEAFWYTFFAMSLFSSFYLFFEGVALVKDEQRENNSLKKTDKVPQCNIKIFDVTNNGLILIILGFILQIAIIVTFDAKRFDFSNKVNIKDNNESSSTSDKNNSLNSQEIGSMSNQIIMNSYNVPEKQHSQSPPKPPTRPPIVVKPCESKENIK